MRRVSVLLRVTLYRRLAELSFRGVDFTELPREVVKHTQQDFDTACGAMATQLASLFAFLKSDRTEESEMRDEELVLYADPSYWLYGLLSFRAKSCEAKTAKSGDYQSSKLTGKAKRTVQPPCWSPSEIPWPLRRQSSCHSHAVQTWARQNCLLAMFTFTSRSRQFTRWSSNALHTACRM